ncbi:MAG: hypothetical protein ABIH23_02845 [bacterium]
MEKANISVGEREGLACFGRITASVSHEMNNVLAIVNELAGLLEDLLYGAEQGKAIEPERLTKVSEGIQKQIQRGQKIVQRLNRFAHSVDEPISECDLHGILDDTVGFARRFASLKGVDLQLEFPEDPVSFTNSRFAVQWAVFSCIDLALSVSNKGDCVQIACATQGKTVQVRVVSGESSDSGETAGRLGAISDFMERIGGDLEIVRRDTNRQSIVLTFPHSILVDLLK